MKTALIVIGVIFGIIIIGALVMIIMDREVRRAVIGDVDLTKVPDGLYTGSFHSGRWKNEVEVTIKDHKIVSITNTSELPDKRAQEIVDKATENMLAKQSIAIDVISGASLNTRSFQLAVSNALKDGTEK